jgi:hypothetical protein
MSFATSILRRILRSLQEKTGAWILAGLGTATGVAWLWVWTRFDPNFDYQAQPSGTSAQFVFLSQILSQLEKDSHVILWPGLELARRVGRITELLQFQLRSPVNLPNGNLYT